MTKFRRFSDPDIFAPILFFSAVTLMVLGAITLTASQYFNPQTHTQCTVESKDRTRTENSSDMRVYTSCGVFQVRDMFWNGEFNSADTYGGIEEGTTYDFDTTGYRIPLFSSFPVIRDYGISKSSNVKYDR